MEMNSYIYKSMINRVMHSDIFKAEEDWTKSQQNDWLLGLLYIWKMMYQYLSQMVTYYLWWVLWYFKEFKNAKLGKWQKMLLSLRSNPQTMSPYI